MIKDRASVKSYLRKEGENNTAVSLVIHDVMVAGGPAGKVFFIL